MNAAAALDPGHAITLSGSGRQATVVRFLGSGGQGAVYEIAEGGASLALKLYHPQTVKADPRLPMRLGRAIALGAPDSGFLWPLDHATVPGKSDLVGYVMPLREQRFVGMKRLITAPPDRVSPPLARRAIACLLTAESFHKLHARGQCYQDVSFGNIFLDPDTGEVAVCDNDNVDVNGAPAAVYGTRKFMAPEIVRREALPSTITDLYSMAVMFFYILMSWHPLDGRREHETLILDGDAEFRLYGSSPLFLFDPADPSNGPVEGMHEPIVRRWRSLSKAVRDLFIRAFTTGLAPDAGKRVLETEWIDAFATLRDTVLTCPVCGYEHAADADDADAAPERFACIACGASVPIPPSLRFGRGRLLLANGALLRADRVGPTAGRARNAVVGIVESHPRDPSISGLRNLGKTPWTAAFKDGRTTPVLPGQAVLIEAGCRIGFGLESGVCVAPPTGDAS